MKKLRNEKGFAMAELLAVCIIVLGIFAVLFSNYLPLTAEYENRVTYNNVNAEYAATYIRKAFKDVKVYDALKNLDTTGYYTLYTCESGGGCEIKDGIFTKSDGTSRNSEYEKKKNQIIKFINEYGIQEIIITKYKTKEVKDKYKSGLLYNYIKYIPTFKDYKVTKTGKYRIILKTKDYGYATVPLRYAEPNEPKLDSDMVPVYFDSNDKIKVADKTNESVTHGWYDYVEKKWANVVKLSSGCGINVGDVVADNCIKSMWVWIPRYKYEKFSSKEPTQINVTFITQDNEKDTPHPAFGGKKSTTTGFWIGKYESNGNTIKSGIVPNGKDKQAISPATGSSIITNKQWGAVAYLTYSRYGTCSYNNDSKKVICAGVDHDTDIQTGGKKEYSTTRNMYGVFDMNGGKYEYIDVSADDSRGKGTGTEEVAVSKGKYHKFDHQFLNVGVGLNCHPTGGGCRRWKDGKCVSHYPRVCSCEPDDRTQPTERPWTEYLASGPESCKVGKDYNVEAKTAEGYTLHSWANDMRKGGDGSCSPGTVGYNLRGGAYDGNAWCINTKVDNVAPDENDNLTAKPDTAKKHYDVKSKSYAGIFAYSSSSFVKDKYIVTRAVIKK